MLKNNFIIKILLFVCGIADFIFYYVLKNKVPILLYHSISKTKSRLSVDPEKFEQQMQYLDKRGYKTISSLELKNNKVAKTLVLTFDDGFQDNIKTALPILKKHNFRATVFISTKYIGSQSGYATEGIDKRFNIMTKPEIQELENEGWLIANHFHSHKNLVNLTKDEIIKEINISHMILDETIENKKGLDVYSYPRNKYNQEVNSLMKKNGAVMVFGGESGFFDLKDNIYTSPRIEIDRNVNFDKFKLYLSPSYWFIKNKILKR